MINNQQSSLSMSVYSSLDGIPSALIEERDACGVGFIASLNNKASHSIVQQALVACSCMEHRGATSADGKSGDGAGIMTAIPWDLFSDKVDPFEVRNADNSIATAVGMIFLPRNNDELEKVKNLIESIFTKYHITVKFWRDVPVDDSMLGELSKEFVPFISQIIVQATKISVRESEAEFEKLLYDIRREIQGNFRKLQSGESYVCSLSSKTIVYKGMLRSCDLPLFYLDLKDDRYKSNFAIYHRRFSTNTVPKWFLAQPMRILAHNGEINTLLGNINWVKSRQYAIREQSPKSLIDKKVRGPLVDLGRSDSANLDSILDSYTKSGKTLEESLMILVPEAYHNQPKLKHNVAVRSFYQFYEPMQEAWDGPALLIFSDGNRVGACLDRNGLRPARYMITKGQSDELTVHVMSEVGVTKAIDLFSQENDVSILNKSLKIIESGRLGPGEMLSVDLKMGKLYDNSYIKDNVAAMKPYKKWTENSIIPLKKQDFVEDTKRFINSYIFEPSNQAIASTINIQDSTNAVALELDSRKLIETQTYFGWGTEDVEVQISAMASEGIEATYCMGDDAPLACLSAFPHTLYDYFKQRFAQVTNPPIDSIREGTVMSLNMYLGPRGDPLGTQSLLDKKIKIESPILNMNELKSLSSIPWVKVVELSTLYELEKSLTLGGLKEALSLLCDKALESVDMGATIIHLSDQSADSSDYLGKTYIPPLMAVSAVHHKLIESGKRTKISLILSTGQAWSTHHIACLIGYGASAVIPYLAYDSIVNWHSQKRIQLAIERSDLPNLSLNLALSNYRKSLEKGLLKILSKMGISLLTSYNGAQIFESIGLSDEVIREVFKGTPSRVGGLSYDEIAGEIGQFVYKAFGDNQFSNIIEKVESAKKLFNYGFLNYLKSGDYHHNNQPLIKVLHQALRTKDSELYSIYEKSVMERPPTTLRDMLEIREDYGNPIPLDEVESIEHIMERFCTGGMSLGALSREAHETLAIAMNRINGKSNSGEGGEDPERSIIIDDVDPNSGLSNRFPHLKGLISGDNASSKIKQVASGRFGVTPSYLMSAEQLEIKIAQGAKPGEGGQLPGPKIDNYIATLRNSKPGVTLISPPPHHDIYSIEDLAQLIHDLHAINPAAKVSVKLVSEVGIGTVASGVAKAGADIIQISGHDGGTGASPVSSIKHAGSPWELGLVEAHSTLYNNGLRDRVLIRVDGGLKSGWDIIIAAALGAEEFGFGTIAMIAEGCIMARICHTNKCPVGITTQNEALRKRFSGTPENVVSFFQFVADEVRHILARLGVKSLDQIIGKSEILKRRENINLKKLKNMDVSYLLKTSASSSDRTWLNHGPAAHLSLPFDDMLLSDTEVLSAILGHGIIKKDLRISNTDRSAFARVSGRIAKLHSNYGFKGSLNFNLSGAAGQSFGAFLTQGISLYLNGFANDYVGKGMAGGKITIVPSTPQSSTSAAGNTILYGATGGEVYIRGSVGERFAVRNSGARAVIEGAGDHACEYMTAGTVMILGQVGRNIGAGMTGGLLFVINSFDSSFEDFVNKETVSIIEITEEYQNARNHILSMLLSHYEETGSERALKLIQKFRSSGSLNDITIRALVPNSEKNNPLLFAEILANNVSNVSIS
eukprot:gene19014-24834_t